MNNMYSVSTGVDARTVDLCSLIQAQVGESV